MKKLFSAFALFLICSVSKGQITFQTIYGDSSHSEARAVIQTSDRNFAFIGSQIAGDSSDILFTKVDSLGIPLFTIRDSTARNDYGFDVKLTNDNGFIICGSTTGSPLDPDFEDIILIKADQTGFIQWANVYGGFATDRAYSVSLGYDDSFFLTGYTNSGDSGYSQGFAMKVDYQGNPVWSQANSIFGNSHFHAGCSTSDSSFISAGFVVDSFGSKDLFVVKYDSIGNVRWSKRFSAQGDQDANSVAATSDGGCIIAGINSSDASVHSTDMLAVKLDTAGTIEWSKTYNYLHEDQATQIIQLSNGNYILTGYSNVMDTINPLSMADFIELDPSGDTLVTVMYGDSTANNLFYSVTATPDSGFLLGGTAYGSARPNGTSYLVKIDSAGSTVLCQHSFSLTSSVLVLTDSAGSKVDTIIQNYSGVNLFTDLISVASQYSFTTYCLIQMTAEHNSVSEISVYPNPVQHTLNIDLNDNDLFETLVVSDVFGRIVATRKIQNNESHITLNAENLKPGIYQVELRGQENFVSRKFVKVD